jgi:SAM-dependent methyltransferase
MIFDQQHFLEITNAQLEHLVSLNLDMNNCSVLEVGAGVGNLTHLFESINCKILSTDAREGLVTEHRKRFPDRKVEVADLELSKTYNRFGIFDIVFCYGTLYHLSNPEFAIEKLSKKCKKFFLLETCVFPIDNGKVNLEFEISDLKFNSIHGVGCRPARNWIMEKLKKYYPYSYVTAHQPKHFLYSLNWPSVNQNYYGRAVFIGSKIKLNNPLLLENLPLKQFHLG